MKNYTVAHKMVSEHCNPVHCWTGLLSGTLCESTVLRSITLKYMYERERHTTRNANQNILFCTRFSKIKRKTMLVQNRSENDIKNEKEREIVNT